MKLLSSFWLAPKYPISMDFSKIHIAYKYLTIKTFTGAISVV